MSRERIYLLEKNPKGWKREAHQSAISTFPAPLQPENITNNCMTHQMLKLREAAAKEQHERWKNTVGREPSDSRFTVVLAIHNDHEFLPSALATLLHADIPSATQANFVLITNNCTDDGKSIDTVSSFMSSIGGVTQQSIHDLHLPFSDPQMRPEFSHVQIPNSNISFFHFDTATPGRVNAFELGNALALNFDDQVILCLDANKFPQPNAVREMIGTSYRELYDTPNPAGIITGNFQGEDLGLEENRGLFPANIVPATLHVRGPIMAWNPQWITENGGIPVTLREDSGLELFVLHKKRRVLIAENAHTWGYTPVTTESRIEHLIRYYIGSLQLQDNYPELGPLLQEKTFYMKPWHEVVQILTDWTQSRGPEITAELPFILNTWEYILREGKKRYIKAPDEAGWEPAL